MVSPHSRTWSNDADEFAAPYQRSIWAQWEPSVFQISLLNMLQQYTSKSVERFADTSIGVPRNSMASKKVDGGD